MSFKTTRQAKKVKITLYYSDYDGSESSGEEYNLSFTSEEETPEYEKEEGEEKIKAMVERYEKQIREELNDVKELKKFKKETLDACEKHYQRTRDYGGDRFKT